MWGRIKRFSNASFISARKWPSLRRPVPSFLRPASLRAALAHIHISPLTTGTSPLIPQKLIKFQTRQLRITAAASPSLMCRPCRRRFQFFCHCQSCSASQLDDIRLFSATCLSDRLPTLPAKKCLKKEKHRRARIFFFANHSTFHWVSTRKQNHLVPSDRILPE